MTAETLQEIEAVMTRSLNEQITAQAGDIRL